jgi:hypothetical protein
VFYGNLDTSTLGGAGFASQRTTKELNLDLSKDDGLELIVLPKNSDEKRYTLIFKDTLLPPDPDNGREQSTISWEFDFEVPKASSAGHSSEPVKLFIPWRRFKATYRGKERGDTKPPNLASVKRISIMMRRYGCRHNADPTTCANVLQAFLQSKTASFS